MSVDAFQVRVMRAQDIALALDWAAAEGWNPGLADDACFATADPEGFLLGEIAGCKFYIGAAQFEYWQHTQLVIDVVPGRGSGFSVEAPEGVRFLTRSRVFTDAEVTELEAGEPPVRGAA